MFFAVDPAYILWVSSSSSSREAVNKLVNLPSPLSKCKVTLHLYFLLCFVLFFNNVLGLFVQVNEYSMLLLCSYAKTLHQKFYKCFLVHCPVSCGFTFSLHIEEKHMKDKDLRVNTTQKSPGKIPLNSKKGVNEKSSTNELLSGWLTVKL